MLYLNGAEAKLIPGCKKHFVTDNGKVYSRKKYGFKLLKQHFVRGYVYAAFSENGITVHPKIHRLLLLAFVGKPKKGQVARHLDGVKNHNFLSNLVWGTQKENADDRKRHGTNAQGGSFAKSKLNDLQIRVIRRCKNLTAKFLASIFGVSIPCIGNIWNNKTWKHLESNTNCRAEALTKLLEIKNNGKLNFAQFRILYRCRNLSPSFLKATFHISKNIAIKYSKGRISYEKYGWHNQTLGQYVRDLV